MQNYSYPDSFDKFLAFFQEILEFLKKTLERISENFKTEYTIKCVNWQSMSIQNFGSPAYIQTDLDKLKKNHENSKFFRKFFSKFQKFPKSSMQIYVSTSN
jgi:hypothetical protein